MKSVTFRRAERVSVDGGPGVITFLDETGEVIFVDMRSLIEQIGLPLIEETDRLAQDGVLITALCLAQDYSYVEGIKQKSLFMPLNYVNDYLYSVPINTLRPDAAGNLQFYRERFAIEADRHWSRLEKSQAVANPLEVRTSLVQQGRYQVGQLVKALDGDAAAVYDICIRQVAGRPVPTSTLDARQLDLLSLSLSLSTDILVYCIENGEPFEKALSYIQEGTEKHIVPWNF